MSAAQRIHMMEVYLFGGGEVGDFTDLRILDMARQVPTALNLAMPNPAWHYPQPLVDHIALQLATAESAQTIAEGGDTSVAIDVRNERADLAEAVIARVRFKYCGASDDGDATVELRKIGMKPRGSGGTGAVPGAAGPAVYNAVAKTLTVSALPADSISIRAYRKLLPEGDTELCGVSISPTVSIAQATPLLVGDYEVWVVGFDGDDEGPESPHITVDNTP